MSEKIAIFYSKKNICRLPLVIYTKVNFEDIIYGVNYIDAEYWQEAKKHITVQNKINDGIIKEIKTTESKKEIEIEEVKKEINKDGKEIEKTVKTKKQTSIKITDFNKLSNKEKEDIIINTYKIDTLEAFKDKELDAEIRYQIEKRIDAIKNAKKDEIIDYPDSHLKL